MGSPTSSGPLDAAALGIWPSSAIRNCGKWNPATRGNRHLQVRRLQQRADDLVPELGAIGAATKLLIRNRLRIFRCLKDLHLVPT